MSNSDYSYTILMKEEKFIQGNSSSTVHIFPREVVGKRLVNTTYSINLKTNTIDWHLSINTSNKELYESWKKIIGI